MATGTVHFITGPEGSGTTALVRALSNHPDVVKGDTVRYGGVSLHGTAGDQLIPIGLMSTCRPRRFDLEDPAGALRRLRESVAGFRAAQPERRVIFFKYSTPAFRPPLWPVFLPFFAMPEFRVVVIWRRPLDAIHSAFRRFYRGHRSPALAFLGAARGYTCAVRHICGQLARSPRDRCLSLRYEDLVGRTESTLQDLYAFADLEYRSAEQLLPGRGFSDESGKWKVTLRKTLTGGGL